MTITIIPNNEVGKKVVHVCNAATVAGCTMAVAGLVSGAVYGVSGSKTLGYLSAAAVGISSSYVGMSIYKKMNDISDEEMGK